MYLYSDLGYWAIVIISVILGGLTQAYIKNTYLSDSGQEKNGPVSAESVKRLLVRKVANHQ